MEIFDGLHCDSLIRINESEREEALDDDDFRSCADEDEFKDSEEQIEEVLNDEFDEFSLKMFFKGVSLSLNEDTGSGITGIGVFMERSSKYPALQVQKKLDFHVDESIAEYLALMDGLAEALRHSVRRIFAFTDCQVIYDQIVQTEILDDPLCMALKQRILEHASKLESFDLKLASSCDLEKSLWLAQRAIGSSIIGFCAICFDDKRPSKMIKLGCSHEFCSSCVKIFIEGKIKAHDFPPICPQVSCKYYISMQECKSILSVAHCEKLRTVVMSKILNSDTLRCPFPHCSALIGRSYSTLSSSSSSNRSEGVECPECFRFVCIACGLPWHSEMDCKEYESLNKVENNCEGISSLNLAQNGNWRRCPICRCMVEILEEHSHLTCWYGHQFCYCCDAEYIDGQQTCTCIFNRNSNYLVTNSYQDIEFGRWDPFNSFQQATGVYSDEENSQLALIQQFLNGEFGLSDQIIHQPPPCRSDAYLDTMKDLHQLPWLERFAAVMTDNYYDDYIQRT